MSLPPVMYLAHVRLTPALRDADACDVIGAAIAEQLGAQLRGASQDDDAHRLSWTIEAPNPSDPAVAIGSLTAAIRAAIPAGRDLSFDSLTVLTHAEVRRRIAGEGVPPPGVPLSSGRPALPVCGLVSTAQFADLCGLTPSRVRQLRAERLTADTDGEPHPFPPEFMPGYWEADAARTYAALPRPPAGRRPSGGV